MKLKTRAVLLLDSITQPITQWLAFESTLKEIQSLIPPKDSKTLIKMARTKAKCLPKYLRGAFLYDVTQQIKSSGVDHDVIIETLCQYYIDEYKLEVRSCQ